MKVLMSVAALAAALFCAPVSAEEPKPVNSVRYSIRVTDQPLAEKTMTIAEAEAEIDVAETAVATDGQEARRCNCPECVAAREKERGLVAAALERVRLSVQTRMIEVRGKMLERQEQKLINDAVEIAEENQNLDAQRQYTCPHDWKGQRSITRFEARQDSRMNAHDRAVVKHAGSVHALQLKQQAVATQAAEVKATQRLKSGR